MDEELNTPPEEENYLSHYSTEAIAERANVLAEQQQVQMEQEEEQAATAAKDMGFLPDNPVELVQETGKALWGGGVDAVESVGGFGQRIYDTARWGMHKAYGLPMQDEENIFHQKYDVENPFEIPDNWEPANQSGLGKLTRGIVEFVALDAATWGIGGKVLGANKLAAKASHRLYKASRTGRVGRQIPIVGSLLKTKRGARTIAFLPRGVKIGTEGAIADFVSESSEYANMANLVNQYAPWVPFSEALAVDPEKDNSWTARIKTVFAGAGFNLGGYVLVGLARGKWAAIRSRANGSTIEEANRAGTTKLMQTIEEGEKAQAFANDSMKQLELETGQGIPTDLWNSYLRTYLSPEEFGTYKDLKEGNLNSISNNSVYWHGVPYKQKKDGFGKPLGYEGDKLPQGFKENFSTGQERVWSDENLFGDGFYVTDNLSVSASERVKLGGRQGEVWRLDNRGQNRVVYRVDETPGVPMGDGIYADRKGPVRLLDADEKIPWKSRTKLANLLRRQRLQEEAVSPLEEALGDRWPRLWAKDTEITYAELIAAAKENGYGYYPRERLDSVEQIRERQAWNLEQKQKGVEDPLELQATSDRVLDFIEGLNDEIAELGYGGLTYKVAARGDVPAHQARVYWFPEQQLELSRVDTDLEITTRLDELEDLAKQNGASKSDFWNEQEKMSSLQSAKAKNKPAPFNNGESFDMSEKATIPLDDPKVAVKKAIQETVGNFKRGSDNPAATQIFLESQIKRMAGGSKALAEYIREVVEDVSREIWESPKNTLDQVDIQESLLRQTKEMYEVLFQDGDVAKGLNQGEISKNLEKWIKLDKDNKTVYSYDGLTIETVNSSAFHALTLVTNSLTKRVQLIAQGTLDAPKGVSLIRQADQVFDAMKVSMLEMKKASYMAGSELQRFAGKTKLDPTDIRRKIQQDLTIINQRTNEHFDELARLAKEGTLEQRADLMALYAATNGKVRTMAHLHEYFDALIKGGRMDGDQITGRWRMEARSVYYNSVLSSLKTPLKAIVGTNFISMLRPFQAYLGAWMGGNKREMFLAASQVQALGDAWSEGLKMFKHNWDLGLNRKQQDYATNYSFDTDLKHWQEMKEYIGRQGDKDQMHLYEAMDSLVQMNTAPWMTYSRNAMGAGDAMARTIIGRMEMRNEAARTIMNLVDEGKLDIEDPLALAKSMEEEFRNMIFKRRTDEAGVERWVVSDQATRLAGDEAALTKPIEGRFKFLNEVGHGTGLRAFFPFVKTGYNALELAFGHTELVRFQHRYQDIMRGDPATLLKKYGIKPEKIEYEQAVLKGRLGMGRTIIGLASIAAMTGNLTGDIPADKTTREQWKANGIQPNSFKLGNVYISYRDIEPFNTLLAATANVLNYQHLLGEDYRDEAISKIMFMTTAVIVDKSMLAGVADLGELLNWKEGGEKNIQRIAGNFLRPQLLPYAGLSNQLGRIIDANEKEANNIIEYIARRELGAKSTLAPKYDILSKDRTGKKYYPPPENPLMRLFNGLSPIAISWSDDDPVKKGLLEMSFDVPKILATYNGVRLNSYEMSEIQRYMSMGNLRYRLEQLMTDGGVWRNDLNEYKRLGLRNKNDKIFEQRFYQDVHKIFVEERKNAMEQLMYDNPKLAEKIQTRLDRKSYGKYGRYDAIEELINIPK